MKPFVKWAGGKRQILNDINGFIDDFVGEDKNYTYLEPFLGGGAVFFNRKPNKAIINDLNEDLINAYRVIKSDQYLNLVSLLQEHKEKYTNNPDEYYYDIRSLDRKTGEWPYAYNATERAARMIFLNKTCYNGLYRVNNSGQFNTPIGRYRNPLICDEENITEIHNYLSSPLNKISIMCGSYEKCIRKAKDGDVIYIDPPYDYEDDDGFTKYQMSGFTFDDFKNLKNECDKAINKGAFVIISNNATEKVIKLFEEDPKYKIYYGLTRINTLRTINSNGSERRTGKEVIFCGVNNNIPLPQANDMNKIISMIMSGENGISNPEEAKRVLNVDTTRQVAYYMSALLFFKYITHDKKFTELAKSIYQDRKKIEYDIFNQLFKNDLFRTVYENFDAADLEYISQQIKIHNTQNNTLSDSTIKRRSSTVKKWVEWMVQYNKKNNE
ncbi:MAG: Dam family site-specific DNA-(adenine-N6)-methyltransferase [Clostridia bacterium]|nr:Dam family site-specific DNA-(adenine-N6)-methyltransferase [Clostridia bacterium]